MRYNATATIEIEADNLEQAIEILKKDADYFASEAEFDLIEENKNMEEITL